MIIKNKSKYKQEKENKVRNLFNLCITQAFEYTATTHSYEKTELNIFHIFK